MLTRVVKNGGVDERFIMGKSVTWEEKDKVCCSESSSIGKNSDVSMEKSSGDSEEVESSLKGALDSMEALEKDLPTRRGISRFYNGKSKSFTSLADACSCSSMKEVGKPGNTYTRRRRKQLGCSLIKSNGGGISKRLTSSTRSTLSLAIAMSNDKSVSYSRQHLMYAAE